MTYFDRLEAVATSGRHAHRFDQAERQALQRFLVDARASDSAQDVADMLAFYGAATVQSAAEMKAAKAAA